MSQTTELAALMRKEWITPLDALRLEPHSMRLAARVHELRQQGVKVLGRWREFPTGKRVMEYRIFD